MPFDNIVLAVISKSASKRSSSSVSRFRIASSTLLTASQNGSKRAEVISVVLVAGVSDVVSGRQALRRELHRTLFGQFRDDQPDAPGESNFVRQADSVD